MDVLICKPKPSRDVLDKFLKETLRSREVAPNGDVISFEYKNFQVDLIFVAPENFEIATVFFAFNDLGNLMGRIAHRFGLKYGFQGLTYPVNAPDGTRLGNILLSRDPRRIFEFIGFDYDRFLQGFDELKDIFDYVLSSKYFDCSIFDREKMSKINRKRDRKRKTFNAFVDYVLANNVQKQYAFEDDKSRYLPWIDAAFPEVHLMDRIHELNEAHRIKKAAAAKFNGSMIMKLIPELSGKALGVFIAEFKKAKLQKLQPELQQQQQTEEQMNIRTSGGDDSDDEDEITTTEDHSKDPFEEYVLRTSEEQLREEILEFYKKRQHSEGQTSNK
eukprot:GEZU01003129.1.p1 GENE.GEZU01003129.1~~GEZU01003129.1.p1  ORF type:complete len:331 (+),score=118.41 GEZU01003129.1:368-1360(+)